MNDKTKEHIELMIHHFNMARDAKESKISLLAHLGIDYAIEQQKLKNDVQVFKDSPFGEIVNAMEMIQNLKQKLKECQNKKDWE